MINITREDTSALHFCSNGVNSYMQGRDEIGIDEVLELSIRYYEQGKYRTYAIAACLYKLNASADFAQWAYEHCGFLTDAERYLNAVNQYLAVGLLGDAAISASGMSFPSRLIFSTSEEAYAQVNAWILNKVTEIEAQGE